MTAEIAVLNKFGVALAADSAITVDHYHDNEVKTKVYNTANKLFSMSKFEPIGIMFYNTVTIGGIPWEAIIKSYRKRLSRTKFDTLKQYADDFFSWLNSKPHVFTDSHITDIVETNFFREFGMLRHGCKNKSQFEAKLDRRIADLEVLEYIEGFDAAFGKEARNLYKDELDNAAKYMIKTNSYVHGCKNKIDKFVELRLTKKRPLRGYSGIVIAGFGDKEALPSLYEYTVDILVNGRVRFWLKKSYEINEDNLSDVVPLADSEAMRTLIEGISPAFRTHAFNGAYRLLLDMPENILSPITELTDQQKKKYIADAKKVIPATFRDYSKSMVDFRNKNYTNPIKQSIGSLPVSELGTVAEAFLGASQVLKKVNPDLETIGGPVDIAVISKGDGFIWIKRKHYFSEIINPSFKLRYLDS
jgi:hypothetical protein